MAARLLIGHAGDVLSSLELSPTEEAVYARLLEAPLHGGTNDWPEVDDPTSEVAAALAHLVELGLVARLPTTPPLYLAVPWEAVAGMVAARAEHAAAAARSFIEHLASRFHPLDASSDRSLIEVFVGGEDCVRQYAKVLRGAREEVRACETPFFYSRHQGVNELEIEGLDRGIRYRVLYDRAGFDTPDRMTELDISLAAGELIGIVDVPVKFMLTDYPLGWLPPWHESQGTPMRLLVRDSVLLHGLSEYFELLWRQSVPLQTKQATESPDLLTTEEHTNLILMRLLAAGQSERAIADYLHCHKQTSHRRIRAMMASLDAHTPFQAGYQAVRRGYLADSPAQDG